MKTIMSVIALVVLALPSVGWAQGAVAGAPVPNVSEDGPEVAASTAPVKTSESKIVYVVNPGPFTIKVRVIGGQKGARAEDVIKPRQIGKFVYKGFDLITLEAQVLNTSGFMTKTERTAKPDPFKDGAWLWVFRPDGQDSAPTQDLKGLPIKDPDLN